MLRDGLHDALLRGLLVLVGELVNGLEVGDADLHSFGSALALAASAVASSASASNIRRSIVGWRVFYASVWATLGCKARRSVSQLGRYTRVSYCNDNAVAVRNRVNGSRVDKYPVCL